MPKRIQAKSGDVFAFELDGAGFGFGRVLLNVLALHRGKAMKRRVGANAELLVEHVRLVRPTPELSADAFASAERCLSEYAFDRSIRTGESPIVGHLPVSPDAIDFPEHFAVVDDRVHVEKGELRFPLDVPPADRPRPDAEVPARAHDVVYLATGIDPTPLPSTDWGPYPPLFLSMLADGTPWRAASDDLRAHPDRARAFAFAGVAVPPDYDRLAASAGFATRAQLLAGR